MFGTAENNASIKINVELFANLIPTSSNVQNLQLEKLGFVLELQIVRLLFLNGCDE